MQDVDTGAAIGKASDPSQKRFQDRSEAYRSLLEAMRERAERIALGGGKKRIEREHERGKMTARERIAALLDDENDFLELGTFAGYEMYEEHGGCPAAGVGGGASATSAAGYVRHCGQRRHGQSRRLVSDHGKKNLRAQEIAMENRVPIIYLVDSAQGVYLPMQDEIFPDKEHFGRIFRNNARMSAGHPADRSHHGKLRGRRRLPAHYVRRVADRGRVQGSVFLAGSLTSSRQPSGRRSTTETLGGAKTHSEISGVTDYRKVKDDAGPASAPSGPTGGRGLGDGTKPALTARNRCLPAFPRRNLSSSIPDRRSSSSMT
jgi:3-methylcrotonyl-CoA carboxylase beta subunit